MVTSAHDRGKTVVSKCKFEKCHLEWSDATAVMPHVVEDALVAPLDTEPVDVML